MTAPDPRRIRDLFLDALDVEDSQRDAFLDDACDGDVELRAQVASLLDAEGRSRGFLVREDEDDGLVGRLLAALEDGDGRRHAAPPDLSGALVGDRYLVHETIGHGGFGVVYRATDQFLDRDVAVKFIPRHVRFGADSTRRELSALLILDVPGVVRLVDDGDYQGLAYVVTELVHGHPFPGRTIPARWIDIAPTLDHLLETLVRVHWSGVVHGDLKPENVLVDDDGRVTLLDLGISSGPSVEISGELGRTSAGTLPYLAPEQLDTERAPPTERTDLFSVGVLIFHALTGRVPHQRTSLRALVQARIAEGPDFSPLAEIEMPANVRRLLSHLLAHRPEDRPENAASALAMLRGERTPQGEFRSRAFSWLSRYVDLVVTKARSHESLDLVGESGSGRTWILERVRATLEAQSIRTWMVGPGTGPCGSLAATFGDTGVGEPDLDRQLHDALRRGEVVLADDWERVDARSRQLLSEARGAGTVIRCGTAIGRGAVHIAPATASELRSLFAGHDRLFHLPEDAAELLHERTNGVAQRVVTELSSWVRMRLARIEGRRVVVDRVALQRIAAMPAGDLTSPASPSVALPNARCADVLRVLALAGPSTAQDVAHVLAGDAETTARDLTALESVGAVHRRASGRYAAAIPPPAWDAWSPSRRRAVHSALADIAPANSPERTRHLIDAGRFEDVAASVVETAASLVDDGRAVLARELVDRALAAVRAASPDPTLDTPMIATAFKLAQAEGTPRAFELALHEMQRSEARGGDVREFEAMTRAALLVARGDSRRALARLRGLGSFPGTREELARRALCQFAARRLGAAVLAEVDDDCQAWAAEQTDPFVAAAAAAWRGWRAYREGRFSDAAASHQVAADAQPDPMRSADSRLNFASASLEAYALADAERAALDVVAFARSVRHPHLEARAERIARAARYRQRAELEPDVDLVEASAHLRAPNVSAMLALNEGAIAWRTGSTLAPRLAETSAEIFESVRSRAGAALARALIAAAGGDASSARADMDDAAQIPLPGIALQVIGLYALASEPVLDRDREQARRALERVPEAQRGYRREVISAREAAEAVDSSP